MILVAAFFVSVATFAQDSEKASEKASGLNFLKVDSFKQAQLLAQNSKKILMVDVYATWCGPCQMLSKNVFPSSSVESLNSTIVAYKIDAEKGEGPSFAKSMSVTAYPTLIFFKNGKEVARMVGAPTSPSAFVTAVKKALADI